MENGILNRLESAAFQGNIPLFATFEITLGCNLRCAHCYNFDRSDHKPESAAKALTAAEILRAIDELVDAGALFIAFTGGEALAHPRLPDFIRRARERGAVVRVKSNGTLLTIARVSELVAAGATGCDVSLYGASPATHDALTRIAGSFERTVRGLTNARDGGLTPKISFILNRLNIGELDEMIAFAERKGIRADFSTEMTARHDGTRGSLDWQLEPGQFEKLLKGPHGAMFALFNSKGEVRCPCARSVVGVSSSGDVYPCIGNPMPSGNLRERSFIDIWKNSEALKRIRALEIEDFKGCAPCTLRKSCSRSLGAAYVNTGDCTLPDPQSCMEAKARHEYAPPA